MESDQLSALVTGFILAQYDWRMAFIIPGAVSIILGLSYLAYTRGDGVRSVVSTGDWFHTCPI
jgi:sugar phosphate permease